MKVGIVTNLAGKGLQCDGELLQEFLISEGHTAELIQFDQPCESTFDLGIFLEVVNQHLFSIAPRLWLIPNCEWLKPELVRPAQRGFEKILAKTRDAEKALREIFHNVVYVGFLAKDNLSSEIAREDRCLHVGGDSGFKNTGEVIAAWREYRYWDDRPMPDLTVISRSKTVSFEDTPGITFLSSVEPHELIRLQNSHRFHIMPSAYEGWGQALHEAQSVGAILLTTGAGPMAELQAPFEVPEVGNRKNNLGVLYEVSPRDIREKVPEMLAQPNYELARMSIEARARFEEGNRAFKTAFKALLEPQVASVTVGEGQSTPKVPVAVYGNIGAEHSTENEWIRSFRALGHQVYGFQENEDQTETVLTDCIRQGIKLFLFIHTHQWSAPGQISQDSLVEGLRTAGIKTVSPHLDLYAGLNESDQRESRVGDHAFFRTDVVMTADGSSQDFFTSRKVNHVWLPPAVVEEGCTPGEYCKELAVDIGFTGQRGYHSEYRFREELISTLEAVYGDRFRLFQGYRGKRLNDLYASVKILIGDCCFSGKPKYWSDRLPETCGRGGFLLYPQIKGMCIPTATFEPQNIHDLLEKIEYYLSHDEERELIRKAAWKHVKEHDTYTHRARQILEVCGLCRN